ncbi:MAG: hypothetical protein F4Z77_08405 [Dehalococcoidia bacterium]|nr:hypothetical protein [Dehalococcoidia bacterium]MYA52024.1 hypothetical protein [Dehalococcoidia bacterium]
MTDDQFQTLNRAVGNLAVVVGEIHADLSDLKGTVAGLQATVHEEVLPSLRRIDDHLAVVESRWSNIEGRLATSEMRYATLEQIVYKRDDPTP